MTDTTTQVDPAAIMRIKDLPLRARGVVEGFLSGLHRSPYHGFSVEFSEYRPYSVGDDPRGLDWKLYARSDRYYVKRFEDETNRRCHLIVDQSNSMGYGSLAYTKAEYARTLAATIAYYLSLQRDGVGLITFAEAIDQVLPAKHRPGHLRQIMAALSRPMSGSTTTLRAPLEHLAQIASRRGLVIIVSDLLVPLDDVSQSLSLLRARGHEVIILRILDPAELRLPIDAPELIVDMETGKDMYVDPRQAAQAYAERFSAHRESLKQICDSRGIDFFEVLTDRPLEASLFDLVAAQTRHRRASSSRGGAPR